MAERITGGGSVYAKRALGFRANPSVGQMRIKKVQLTPGCNGTSDREAPRN